MYYQNKQMNLSETWQWKSVTNIELQVTGLNPLPHLIQYKVA
jgi:hypothetical protein